MDLLALLLGIVVGIIAGFVIARFTTPKEGSNDFLRQDLESNRAELKSLQEKYSEAVLAREKLQQELMYLSKEIEQKDTRAREREVEFSQRRADFEKEIIDTRQRLEKEFELISNRLITNQSEQFTKVNQEQIGNLLNPLKNQLGEFKLQVEKAYGDEREGQGKLFQQLEQLKEMNQKLSEGASNLASALKGDSKVQGDWGESHLEVILQKAGLQKDIHYLTQQSFSGSEGRQRPDFLIKLPENRSIVVDSKVSLTAYERYHSSDELTSATALKEHVASMRTHISQLSAKNYDQITGINTLDFVLMYIPIEPALSLALSNEPKLYEEALNKNIVLVSTTTLLATMRTVSYIWKQEDQRKNVQEIILAGSNLYDKFVAFTEDMLQVGKTLESSMSAYDAAMNKLKEGKGNLIGRADKMRKLGLTNKKNINPQLLSDNDLESEASDEE
ncbi:MAG: DNA recombination protein RmuC [Cryomorphaceae bacterium]|nr:DNA recombination protein RmuC [Cryomorphaceae bacterium]